MLPEISLNVLDIAQNSITAEASRIDLLVEISTATKEMKFQIRDNGRGMDQEQLRAVTDPFYTTRTTRKVGLGVPFLKMGAECTGGSFSITSEINKGTSMCAVYHTDHVDCMPLGNISETIHTLVVFNEPIRFVYRYQVDDHAFTLDTDEFHEVLGDVSFQELEISAYILDYLKENTREINETAGIEYGGV